MELCGAKLRNKDATCRKSPMAGASRCVLHGGASLKGLASPAFKTGKYSKNIPTRLMERYSESLEDPDLLVNREELALTDARLMDLLARVDTGESGRIWGNVQEVFADLKRAVREQETAKIGNALRLLDVLITEGVQDYEAWDEVNKQVERRRRLTESEIRRLEKAHQTITTDKLMILVVQMINIVRQEVPERDRLSRISNGFNNLLRSGD